MGSDTALIHQYKQYFSRCPLSSLKDKPANLFVKVRVKTKINVWPQTGESEIRNQAAALGVITGWIG